MLYIGTWNLTRTLDSGQFRCPNCRAARDYRLRSTRPFLTIYFIPIVPIGPRLTFVRCSSCKENFETHVLELDSHQALERDARHTAEEIMTAAILATCADDEIDDAEIDALLEVAMQLNLEFDRETLGEFCSAVEQQRFRALPYLKSVVHRWNEAERQTAAQLIFLAASATGQLSPAQSQVLVQLPKILGMESVEFQRVINRVL